LALNLNGFCAGLPQFIKQCNKSTFINLLLVTSIQKNNYGYQAFMQGTSYPIARRRIVEIKEDFLKIKTGHIEAGHCHNCVKCKVAV